MTFSSTISPTLLDCIVTLIGTSVRRFGSPVSSIRTSLSPARSAIAT
jgi:hypothetical protein